MLNINKKEDISEMMKYHRTKDMINLINYFSELSPIKDLTIVKSVEDYKENYEFAISGHTEGKSFLPWQMFDKSRY